jgi:ribosomal protein S12 methylthiotransferase
VRYLKVSEGCDHGCAFCAIPLMRGRHRSFALGDVVREAQLLELQGAREINLVAQDLAHYGRDKRDGNALPELLSALVAETSIPWIRLLYLYPTGITSKLLDVLSREPRVLPYLDMPIQHGSDAVLARMRRPERAHTIRERVARLRATVPDVAIRTTCIVGFPGETESDFEQLCDLLEEVRFERVGAFTYSPQEGTSGALLDDAVPMPVKRDRLERLTELQRAITAERYERHIGQRVRGIVDRVDDIAGETVGRIVCQADDIDGITRFHGSAAPGSIVEAIVEDVVDDYDFVARIAAVHVAPAAVSPVARSQRSLPVMASATTASYGR